MKEGRQPLFSIRDSKAVTYATPFPSANADTAVRSVRIALADPQHPLRQTPADYQLYAIGEWDDTTGELIAHPPTMLVSLDELVEGQEE